MEFSWTYYKQMNIAFCLMVANMLKKIYAGRPDDYAEALHRHCAFFNITVQFAPFVGGIAMAMEEKVARGEIEPESVNDVKAPSWARCPASATPSSCRRCAWSPPRWASACARPATPSAPSLPAHLQRPRLRAARLGRRQGLRAGRGLPGRGPEDRPHAEDHDLRGNRGRHGRGRHVQGHVLGQHPGGHRLGRGRQTLQDILDGIMPGMLGMLAFWLYYWLLSKKINPMVLIVATMVVGIVGAFFGVLA